jgi:hypothetical protein
VPLQALADLRGNTFLIHGCTEKKKLFLTSAAVFPKNLLSVLDLFSFWRYKGASLRAVRRKRKRLTGAETTNFRRAGTNRPSAHCTRGQDNGCT